MTTSGGENGPEIDVDMARRFLNLLDPHGVFTFQTFPERKGAPGTLARALHGRFEDVQQELVKLNRQGAGVFVMVNQGDGIPHAGRTCRCAANVKRIRAYTLDLDGPPLDAVLAASAKPHILVQTSPGKWHVYWLVDGPEVHDGNRAEIAHSYHEEQVALATTFGADKNACDLARVLRMPGFLHQKSVPYLARLLNGREEVGDAGA
jgi:hypothetical protein